MLIPITLGAVVSIGLIYELKHHSMAVNMGTKTPVVSSEAAKFEPPLVTTEIETLPNSQAKISTFAPPRSADRSQALVNFLNPQEKDRITPDFRLLVPAVNDPEDIAEILVLIRNDNEGDAERHEGIELLRRSQFEGIDALTIELLKKPQEGERFRAFLAQHLGGELVDKSNKINYHNVTEMQGLLSDRHMAVRREALLALVRIGDAESIAIVRRGLSDPGWKESRDLILYCAYDLSESQIIPEARILAYSDDEVVRIAAINVLGKWKDEISRPAFNEASQSSRVRLQRAGQLALQLLEGRSGSALVNPRSSFSEAARPQPHQATNTLPKSLNADP